MSPSREVFSIVLFLLPFPLSFQHEISAESLCLPFTGGLEASLFPPFFRRLYSPSHVANALREGRFPQDHFVESHRFLLSLSPSIPTAPIFFFVSRSFFKAVSFRLVFFLGLGQRFLSGISAPISAVARVVPSCCWIFCFSAGKDFIYGCPPNRCCD